MFISWFITFANSCCQVSRSALAGSIRPTNSFPTLQAAFHWQLHLRKSWSAYTHHITAAHYRLLPSAVVQSQQSTVHYTVTHLHTLVMPPSSPTAASSAQPGPPTTSPHTATASMLNPTATPSTPASHISKKSPLSSTTRMASAILQSRLTHSRASPRISLTWQSL